jgi:hypothetical protein
MIPRDASVYNDKNLLFDNYLAWFDEKKKVFKAIMNIKDKSLNNMLNISSGNGLLTKEVES